MQFKLFGPALVTQDTACSVRPNSYHVELVSYIYIVVSKFIWQCVCLLLWRIVIFKNVSQVTLYCSILRIHMDFVEGTDPLLIEMILASIAWGIRRSLIICFLTVLFFRYSLSDCVSNMLHLFFLTSRIHNSGNVWNVKTLRNIHQQPNS